MKKLLTLLAAAAALLTTALPVTANDGGRTVCVLRQRPVAIHAAPRIMVDAGPVRYQQRAATYTNNGSWRYGSGGYSYSPYNYSSYYSPSIWGQYNYSPYGGRGGYGGNYYGGRGFGGSYGRYPHNGYVGGLRNLPSIVIQIPHTFGRHRSR